MFRSFPYVLLYHKHDFSGKTKAFIFARSLSPLVVFPFQSSVSISPVFHRIITELCVEAFKIQTQKYYEPKTKDNGMCLRHTDRNNNGIISTKL